MKNHCDGREAVKDGRQALVSVIIPTYNRAGILMASVSSVLGQTYENLELIIVDDGSADQTKALIESVSDNRLKYVYQENSGACAARNHGISLAAGDYIAFHDSDDIWYPDKLEKEMAVFEAVDTDVVICKLRMKDFKGRELLYPKRIGEGFVSFDDDLFGIGTQTILAKKEVLERVKFDGNLPRYQDLDWMLRVLRQFRVYCLNKALVSYLVNADSISSDPLKMYRALRIFSEKYPSISSDSPMVSLHILRNIIGNRRALQKNPHIGKNGCCGLMKRFWPGLTGFSKCVFRAARIKRQEKGSRSC